MTLHLYNTLTKRKEEFKPLHKGKGLMYSCGPTVYSHPHIGNFRSFVCADLLRRYLEYKGFQVTQIMNITDVGHMTTDDDPSSAEAGEDKVQAAARKEKKSPLEITKSYTQKFLEMSQKLNLKPADKYPLATEHIPEMIEMVKTLIQKGYAYEVSGNIYFDISKFPDYGRLSGNPLDKLVAGARVEVNSEKKSPLDFALWKQDPKHLMQWDSPWRSDSGVPPQAGGKGFPGWHIECSAMSLKYLGERFDIHTGGEDNIFPHHECEIAQSEGALGHKVVNHWFHIKHLLVNNQKMSKSLGNFYTVQGILDKGYLPMDLRYALLNTHYRQPLNFTMESIEASKNALQRVRDFKTKLYELYYNVPVGAMSENDKQRLEILRNHFEQAMDDDLNISEALAHIFDFIREVNKSAISPSFAGAVDNFIAEIFNKVIGIEIGRDITMKRDDSIKLSEQVNTAVNDIPSKIEVLIKKRNEARKHKDYAEADRIKEQIKSEGFAVEDTPSGTRVKKI